MVFKMRTITAIDDDSKHDTHSATLNLDRVLERVMKMNDIGQIDRVIIISDGSSKEYKSANSFAKKKLLDKKHKMLFFIIFIALMMEKVSLIRSEIFFTLTIANPSLI